ncbi:sensor histidine kinase [Sinanaerobacter chloroacetimidivorans]|nr:HAMP domain-containing sensor histidine kinase [Sinanaerobacter chloroacetimidivorans]
MKNKETQNKKRTSENSNTAGKVRLSLVMKLNLHTFSYAIGVLITINILICMMVLFYSLWVSEENAVIIMGADASSEVKNLDFQVEKTDDKELGIDLWPYLHEKTPLKDYEVLRKIGYKTKGDPSRWLEGYYYQMNFPEENTLITYDLGAALSRPIPLFYVLLVLEALILLNGLPKGIRSVRRILRPLSDMTQQAQNLSSVGSLPPEEMKRLRELAGTISNIDASRLDKRLPVDGSQSELSALASAINSMLNRIDEAYGSQVRFVSDASHELRTPISVIQGYANLLDRWGKNDQVTMQEAIDAIKSESENMKELIEQLLFLARGDNETLHLYPEVFDVSEMIEEIIKETQMIDPLHTFRMKATEPNLIYADRQLMKQALRILIDNSIKYTPENGEIVVGVKGETDQIRISVQDNGIGIDAQNLPYIFDRFYRSDESRARKTGGSGLGLSIMKWIIDRHGGTIEVLSRKDIGTRTTIHLSKAALPAEDWIQKTEAETS